MNFGCHLGLAWRRFLPDKDRWFRSQGFQNGARLVNVHITASRELEKGRFGGGGPPSMAANIWFQSVAHNTIFLLDVLLDFSYFWIIYKFLRPMVWIQGCMACGADLYKIQDCCRVWSFWCNSSWQELGHGLSLANDWVLSWLLLTLQGVLRILQALVCRGNLMKEWTKRRLGLLFLWNWIQQIC